MYTRGLLQRMASPWWALVKSVQSFWGSNKKGKIMNGPEPHWHKLMLVQQWQSGGGASGRNAAADPVGSHPQGRSLHF